MSVLRRLERWPSWLWRQVKVYLNIPLPGGIFPRGFESHSLHFLFCFEASVMETVYAVIILFAV
jgi:hypothetical protein